MMEDWSGWWFRIWVQMVGTCFRVSAVTTHHWHFHHVLLEWSEILVLVGYSENWPLNQGSAVVQLATWPNTLSSLFGEPPSIWPRREEKMIEANIGSPCTVSLLLCSTRPHYIQPWIHKTQCIFQFFYTNNKSNSIPSLIVRQHSTIDYVKKNQKLHP